MPMAFEEVNVSVSAGGGGDGSEAEVDATASVRRVSLSERPIVNLADLEPDLDHNGEIDEAEQSVWETLKLADRDGDGQLTLGELHSVCAALITKNHTTRRRSDGVYAKF